MDAIVAVDKGSPVVLLRAAIVTLSAPAASVSDNILTEDPRIFPREDITLCCKGQKEILSSPPSAKTTSCW